MNSQLTGQPRGKVLWLLFYHFFKIALFVVGGGYAILLAAEEIFVKRLHWLKDGELMDMLAIIQTIPGLLAGNAAIYVGYRAAGRLGALVALTGVALPSFLVITVVAMGFSWIPMENGYIQGAFVGVRTALAGLMLVTLIRMWNKTVHDWIQYLIVLACFIGIVFLNWNPGLLLIGAMALGIVYCMGICDKLPAAATELDHDTEDRQ